MTGGGGKNGLLFFKVPQMPLNTPLELRKLPPDICLTLMACLTSPWHSHLLTANTIWQLAWKSKHAASTASLWGENAASLPNYHIFSLRLQPPCPYSWYTKKTVCFSQSNVTHVNDKTKLGCLWQALATPLDRFPIFQVSQTVTLLLTPIQPLLILQRLPLVFFPHLTCFHSQCATYSLLTAFWG